jgi:acylphosphatase
MILAKKHTIFGNISEHSNLIEIEAEGEKANIEAFIASCKKGLTGSRVDEIVVNEKPLAYYDEFSIL